MRRANVISIDPCATIPGLKCSQMRSSSMSRTVRTVDSAKKLWTLVFPSCDAGLGTSLLLLIARLAVCATSLSTAGMTFSLPFLNASWVVVAPTAILCFCIAGFLCRISMPLMAALLCATAFFNPSAAWWLSGAAAIALLTCITGGGWFSADYFIGRRIRQKAQRCNRRQTPSR